ncbi:MAG: polysaccharide biosynthesis/export family protein [Planctomycetes bacterium]|nr:polysaccharide biosynthesis/export family protein [Planctomycetota bacterium]
MKTGPPRSRWGFLGSLLAMLLLLCAPGCILDRVNVERNLMSQRNGIPPAEVASRYRVGCPDVLELTVAQRPELSGRHTIKVDGRIDLGDYGNLRIEGQTVPEVVKLIAQEVGVDKDAIQLRVVDYRSQRLLLFGEVIGWQRSVDYRGPETVLDLLQRVGGVTRGAETRDVYVVRPHLGEHQRPEVFHVDLQAIVLKQDTKTNLRLLPYDQVYVGETRKAQIERAIPPWVKGVYRAVWNNKTAKTSSEP